MNKTRELLNIERDGTLSFGNYTLETKTKLEDFEYQGDLYKVKTFCGITKLEKNGMFVYESIPGTNVEHFNIEERQITFRVLGFQNTQFTLELEAGSEYEVYLDAIHMGKMKTNLSGKLSVSAELGKGVEVKIIRL